MVDHAAIADQITIKGADAPLSGDAIEALARLLVDEVTTDRERTELSITEAPRRSGHGERANVSAAKGC
jgi:hypothetical protein